MRPDYTPHLDLISPFWLVAPLRRGWMWIGSAFGELKVPCLRYQVIIKFKMDAEVDIFLPFSAMINEVDRQVRPKLF
jgi:hypothetical protein